MKTIIHIGQHKTATTSIQKTLMNDSQKCKNSGLYFATELGGEKYHSHYPLNLYCLDDDRFSPKKEKILRSKGAAYLQQLKSQLPQQIEQHYINAREQNCDTVIWSNEGLYLLNSLVEYQRLYDLFSKNSSEMICVCCFRDVKSFQSSYKKQLKSTGFELSPKQGCYNYIEDDSWLFDYDFKKELVRKVFGNNGVFLTYQKTGMVNYFFKCLGYNNLVFDEVRMNIT